MKKVIALTSGTLLALAFPLVSSAQAQITNITGVGNFIINTINNVIVPVLFAIAFIVFIWGVFKTFVLGAGSDESKEQGKSLMLWGLIGFFVMVSVWGLVNILTGSVTFGNNAQTTLPGATGVR